MIACGKFCSCVGREGGTGVWENTEYVAVVERVGFVDEIRRLGFCF